MLNKIQNNVHSMLNEAQKITRMANHSHQRKHTAEVSNYIDMLLAPRPLVTSSKNLIPHNAQKKRSKTTAQNQKQFQRDDSQKRLQTQILCHSVQYRLQPLTQEREILALEPNQSELLSTKIFGLNKPKFLKKIKQNGLPKIKGLKNLQAQNQSKVLKRETTHFPSKIPLISSLYPEQSMILIRKKKKRSLSRHFKNDEECRSPVQSLKRHLIELSQLQPWDSQRAQSHYFHG